MNKSKTKILLPLVGGILLITAGVIFLLDNLGMIKLDWELLIGPMFGIGGLIFLLVFIFDRDEWWALIPGFVLIAIGIIVFMGNNTETVAVRWSGAVFLGLLGLAFLLIYVSRRDQWWPIIPGGALMTLAVVNLLPEDGTTSGIVFFLGMALTFGLVYIVPKSAGKLKWALYPAGAMLIIAILVTLGATNLMDYVLPVALLLGGGYVIFRAIIKK